MEAAIRQVIFSPTEPRLIIVSGPITKIYNLTEQRFEQTWYESYEPVVLSPDGQLLAVNALNKTVTVRHVPSGEIVLQLPTRDDLMKGMAWSRDGQILAVASVDGAVELWHMPEGKQLRILSGPANDLRIWIFPSVAFSPDNQHIASVTKNIITVWRIADGQQLYTLDGHSTAVEALDFSPDGQLLASGSWDTTIKIWRVADGQLLHTFEGPRSWVRTVQFSPDGTMLAAGGGGVTTDNDSAIRVWRIADGQLLRTFTGHWDYVTSVAWQPDGQQLASSSVDRTVRFWSLK
jgi:WD40 repeat protein